MLLEFSFSGMIDEALSVITSIITFIQNNTMLITLLGISIGLSLVFTVYARLHR